MKTALTLIALAATVVAANAQMYQTPVTGVPVVAPPPPKVQLHPHIEDRRYDDTTLMIPYARDLKPLPWMLPKGQN